MKISLQIILADARSPGRGLPPQPFDRHVSRELPDLDNIIQERESRWVTARGRVQSNYHALPGPPPPAAGPRAGSGDRSLRARSGVRGPPAQLRDGPRSSHQGPTTQGAPEPRRPASGRAVSLPLMPNSAGGPVPAAGFPALPALTPRMPRPVPPSQEKAAASPVSRTLPAGPRENPVSSVARLSASWASAAITLSLQPWAAPSLRAPHRGLK